MRHRTLRCVRASASDRGQLGVLAGDRVDDAVQVGGDLLGDEPLRRAGPQELTGLALQPDLGPGQALRLGGQRELDREPAVGSRPDPDRLRRREVVGQRSQPLDLVVGRPCRRQSRRRAGHRGPLVAEVTELDRAELAEPRPQPSSRRRSRAADERPPVAATTRLDHAPIAKGGERLPQRERGHPELAGEHALAGNCSPLAKSPSWMASASC